MASHAATVKLTTRQRATHTGDVAARFISLVLAASILGIAFLLIYQLFLSSGPARAATGWEFLSSSAWNPVTEEFGAAPFIYGTAVTALLAMLISVPMGLGAAIFLAELAPAGVSNALTFIIELLAAIPSVIYGLLAIFTLVPLMRSYGEPFLKSTLGFLPLFQGPAYGVGYLTAGLVLAIMTVPFVISVSREALLAVPREQREAALALGATRWESTRQVVVPYVKLGILGSIFLGLARAIGETMAVTMVIGNVPKIHVSLLAPGYSIAAVIANEFSEAGGKIHPAALVELGLVLFCLTIVINGGARLMIVATTPQGSKRA